MATPTEMAKKWKNQIHVTCVTVAVAKSNAQVWRATHAKIVSRTTFPANAAPNTTTVLL